MVPGLDPVEKASPPTKLAISCRPGGVWTLTVIFMCECLALSALQLPSSLSLQSASYMTSSGGCFEVDVPGFAHAENFFLVAGIPIPAELERKSAQIDRASIVVTPKGPKGDVEIFGHWPAVRSKLDDFDKVETLKTYYVFKRREPR